MNKLKQPNKKTKTQKNQEQASLIQEEKRTWDEKAQIQGNNANLAGNTQQAGFKYTRQQV